MNLFHKILILLFGIAISLQAVPPILNYAGQVAVNGEAFDGNGLFKFALINADGTTTYWSNDGTSVNGSEPQASVAVSVNGGLYSILLGNSAQQGMGAIDPVLFAQHTDAKLRVWFSDGVNGFQQLSPDRPFASVPYAFNSKSADSANVATTAMAVQTGAITKQMLGQDVLSDLNRTVNHNDLSPQIKADINATIGMNRLSTEVTEKLNQEKTTNNYNAPSVGSLLAVPYGSEAPAGYSLYQRGEPKELVWEEKAPVSVPRSVYDGVEILNSKIYIIGGHTSGNLTERFDPMSNTIETLTSMSTSRVGVASTVFDQKIYAIGGRGLSSVEVFNDLTDQWTSVPNLPNIVDRGTAITHDEQIYLIGGRNSLGQDINQTILFNSSSNTWLNRASMLTKRHSHKLVSFEGRIWAIGGWNESSDSALNQVESYDPVTNSWRLEESLNRLRAWSVAWVANGGIYVGGGYDGTYLKSIEFYDSSKKQWLTVGEFPENKYASDSAVINDQVYVIAGATASGVYSKKVFAADLNASVEGIYDLYRKDGDAPVGTPLVQSEYADGSVTGSKMADGAVTASKIASKTIGKDQISDSILKYLKPEISAQPQIHGVYAGTNTSIPVIAEGKYLTYQWKKDGVDLTDETNATLIITDANATLHDGNYSVVVSNDFGSVESNKVEVQISDALLNGLVGWWKFDEGSGTVAHDSSGNGNDGSLINGPTWTTGKIGGALSFDGVDDLLLLPHSTLAERNLFSYCLWFYATETSSIQHTFLSAANSVRFNEFLFWTKSQQLEIQYKNNVIGITSSLNSEYWLNKWKYLTLIYNPNRLLIYSNGQEVFDINYSLQSLNIDSGGLILGADQDSFGGGFQSNQFVKGLIDDLRIYDRALSAEEVQALYNLGQ